MATFVLLLIALYAGSTHAAFGVVSSNPVTIDKYPSVVQVDFLAVSTGFWGHSCGGNILTSIYILSAAHCFHGINYVPTNRRVRAGTSYLNTDGMLSYVAQEFNHPSYGNNGNDGDITVVRLLTPLVYSSVIAQSTIVSQGAGLPDHLPLIHAGWSPTTQGGSPSPILLEASVVTVNRASCANIYQTLSFPEVVTENMICVGQVNVADANECSGDSGAPLYYDDPVFGNVVVAIVSFGYGCVDPNFPGVTTAVSAYTDWILATAV